MHPQSELENYKLQVELLQEKLHRSEDNRQELEGKLEQIMKKRNEHERTLRSRSQRKYQQFLDEQKKRNERNRTLVEMLERIDQQAAALSARSERLKMMKLQYELYFSKLVQSYSMKTLQGIPTTSFLPIQRPPNTYTTVKSDEVVPALLNNSTPQFQTVPIPVVVPIPNEQNRFQRSWAFATAPPGVLITLANNSTHPSTDMCDNKKNESNFSFDYSQFPIGYLQTPTTTTPIQCNVGQSYLQQPQQQNQPLERHMQALFTPDDVAKQLRPDFEIRDKTLSSFSFTNVKTDEPFSKRTQPESNPHIFNLSSETPRKNDEFEIKRDKENGHQPEIFPQISLPEMPNNDTSVLRQGLKVDKLPNITPNNTSQQRTEDGRTVHRGNKPNTIDFRTDNDKYIKYIKEMKETYDKNAQAPLSFDVTPTTEHSIDNITTTLRIQKIDETNVEDDEKINDAEDNEKNTSSAFPPLGGKCSMESIGDEALTTKPLKNKTEENTSNTAARNIDPSRDTEQITLFNGTKNSKDERTGASNRTAAIIDGVGENTESTPESTDLETSYRPLHFDKKEKMSIEKIETAIYGELLPKPESLTSVDLLDKSKGNMVKKEIEQNSQQPEEYEFNNSAKDLYEQGTVSGKEHPVELYSMNNEQSDTKNEEVIDNNQEAYKYNDNVAAGLQEYDYSYSDPSQEYKEVNQEGVQGFIYPDPSQEYKETNQEDAQSYDYSNPTQEYSEVNQEEVPQQEYSFTENGQQPQIDNYATDYQNYDASQYQGEYDPNAYQYDYEQQQQYNDPNQAQYASEMYNQEYQQDPYSGEYANYEQNASNEIDPSPQGYTDQQYVPEEQVVIEEPIEKTVSPKKESIEGNAEMSITSNIDQMHEEIEPQKEVTPTSILATEKHIDLASKKKKRVNFVDSETDESSTLPKAEAISSESDFDFSAN